MVAKVPGGEECTSRPVRDPSAPAIVWKGVGAAPGPAGGGFRSDWRRASGRSVAPAKLAVAPAFVSVLALGHVIPALPIRAGEDAGAARQIREAAGLCERGRYAEAIALYERVLRGWTTGGRVAAAGDAPTGEVSETERPAGKSSAGTTDVVGGKSVAGDEVARPEGATGESANPAAGRAAAVLGLARARRAVGKYAEALREVEELLAASPRNAAALTLKGELLADVGRYADAAAALDAAIAADGKCHRARAFRKLIADTVGDRKLSKELTDFFFRYWEDNFEALTSDDIADPLLPMYVGMAFQEENAKDAYEVCYAQSISVLKKRGKFLDEPLLRAGLLALEKYDFRKAAEHFKTILDVNPAHPDALLGMALTVSEAGQGDRDRVQSFVSKALETNPNHTDSHAALAAIYLDERRYAEAASCIERALLVNPNHLRALSLMAALALARGDGAGYEAACRRALEINPRYAELYCAVGDSLERRRRFRHALEYFRKAVALDPDYWRGHYCLGMSLARLGEEEEGRRYLARSYRMNGFNIWAYNTLRVLDKILGDPASKVPPQFVSIGDGALFATKAHEKEAAIIGPYAVEIQRRAWDRLTRRLGFEPKRPVFIEYFPTPDDFSARTVGLPGLGALGCCFGEAVTAVSPKAAADRLHQPFNWARVIEHEFTHVLTLQATDYRISRWATEGFSTYLEGDGQPQWDVLLLDAVRRGLILPVSRLEEGFQRQDFPGRIQLTYLQVQLFMEYLDATFGWGCLTKILDGYREGKEDPEILRGATGKTPEELDAGFLEWLKRTKTATIPLWPSYTPKDVAELEKAAAGRPDDAATLAELAVARFRIRRLDAARSAAEAALRSDPANLTALTVRGMIARHADGDAKAAERAFAAATKAPGNPFLAWQHLGALRRDAGEVAGAIEAFEKARRLYSRYAFKEDNPYHELHDLYLKTGNRAAALEVMMECLRIHLSDFEACRKALRLAVELGRTGDAIEAAWAGNTINPFDKEFHALAGKACEEAAGRAAAAGGHAAAGYLEAAAREYAVLSALDGNDAANWTRLAGVLAKLGRKREAAAAAERALMIDATDAGAKAILNATR
ncbi:MAG: tetratricopeptide repeat protein [Planctomycetota bacterium]|nr:tetratricopeptide repeat protein [Planctomycetota bacterium]